MRRAMMLAGKTGGAPATFANATMVAGFDAPNNETGFTSGVMGSMTPNSFAGGPPNGDVISWHRVSATLGGALQDSWWYELRGSLAYNQVTRDWLAANFSKFVFAGSPRPITSWGAFDPENKIGYIPETGKYTPPANGGTYSVGLSA